MYKRILVPVDGSPTSKLGLRHAVGLARPLGARLLDVQKSLGDGGGGSPTRHS